MEKKSPRSTIGESRRELLSPLPNDLPPSSPMDALPIHHSDVYDESSAPSWRLRLTEFRLPPRDPHRHRHPLSRFSCRHLLPAPRKERKIAEYYKKQESLLEGYNEMEAITESGCFPGGLTEVDSSELMSSYISLVSDL